MIAERGRQNLCWLKWFAGTLALSALGCGSDSAPHSDASPSMAAPPSAPMMSAAPSSTGAGKTSTPATTVKPAMSSSAMAVDSAGSVAKAGDAVTSAAAAGAKMVAADGGSSGAKVAAAEGGASAAVSGGAGSGAGAQAAAGAAGTVPGGAAGSGAADEGVVKHEDLGKGDGHDVVLMGDSWMSNTLQVEGTGGGLAPSLQRAAGKPYRNYGVQGVMLLSPDAFGPAIPTQWDTAKAVNPDIKTVVMTGGGNDVIQNPGLQSDCRMDGDQCKMFRMQLMAALDKLWTQMAADGVRDVIYVRYSSNAGGGNNGGMKPSSDQQNMTVPVCLTGKISCHALPTDDLVMNDLAGDGIHPLFTANDRMAKAIVDMMEKNGMRR